MKISKPWLYGIALLLLIAAEFPWAHSHHDAFGWETFPGVYGFLGFAGGLALMGMAKALGKFWLYRKEDYYRHD